MSERVRQTILASLFGSKRIVVAACAAIAMVLGAMSAGASVFNHDTSPRTPDMSSVFSPATIDDSNAKKVTPDDKTSSALPQQHALDPRGVMQLQRSPLYSYSTSTTPSAVRSVAPPKNPLTETLKTLAKSPIFQDQASLLSDLQAKAIDTLTNLLPATDSNSSTVNATADGSNPSAGAATPSDGATADPNSSNGAANPGDNTASNPLSSQPSTLSAPSSDPTPPPQ